MSKYEITDKLNSSDISSINGYDIIERIGVGSYGRVYKVLKNKKYYVLKEIPLNSTSAAEKINSVQNEADILSSLDNKYVVKFYTSFKKNQNIYIIMEYCDKGDLCTFLSKRKKLRKSRDNFLNENFVWKLFIQMSIGLYYIHSKKIIHRDIKTLNIFLTKNFDAKIGDLGVAKILENTKHAMTFIGTPYYVSPEMCRNKPYNEKSDIWALGCILYELLTFNHPFTATNQAALFIKILNNKYNPFPHEVPEDLKNMVDFILKKDDTKRPSMKEIITSSNFQYNALKLGLDGDLKDVLGINILPIQNMKKEINFIDDKICERKTENNYIRNNNINSPRTTKIKLNDNKKEMGRNFINKKNPLIISRSLNDLLKKCYEANLNKNLQKNKQNPESNLINNGRYSENKSLIKNGFNNPKNKRTKSEFNFLEINDINNCEQNPNFKININESKQDNTKKKFSKLPYNKFVLSQKTNINISPRRYYKGFNTSGNKKECFENNALYNKKKNLELKNLINVNRKNIKNGENIKYFETSENLISKTSKSKNRISKKNIYKNSFVNKTAIRTKKIIKILTKKKPNQKNDLISVSEFVSELQNTLKNTQNIITLNDLLNYNFNLEDSKNLNTTNSTTLLEKKDRQSNISEEKYDLILTKLEGEIEKENLDYLNGLCDEFTNTEMIKRSEPFIRNKIPLSNYEIKLNTEKKALKHIEKMNKDELMQTKVLYRNQYEIYLKKIKNYENMIDLNEIKKLYKNKKRFNEKEIKIIIGEINNYLKSKKIQEKYTKEILDIICNLISFEIKYNFTEKALRKINS